MDTYFRIGYFSDMHLKKYLADNKITLSAFAARIGVANAGTVHRYIIDKRIPRPRVMEAIIRETDGAVQANDFYKAA